MAACKEAIRHKIRYGMAIDEREMLLNYVTKKHIMNLIIARPAGKAYSEIINQLERSRRPSPASRPNTQATVRLNIIEYPEKYELQLAVPGFRKDQIEVSVSAGKLWVNGTIEGKKQSNHFSKQEFSIENFSKSFELHDQIDQESIVASYQNGILLVTLTKIGGKIKQATKVVQVS